MTSLTSTESILNAFPYQTIPKIVGTPTYETITESIALLKANAASIQTELGGGRLGFLALTVSPAVYATLSATAFAVPANPGPFPPPLAGNPTGAQIQAANRNHVEALRIFRLYTNVQNALKQQLLTAVDDIYIRALRHRHTAYSNLTVAQLITHLYSTYGRVTPMSLQANDDRFRTAYDPAQPFETLVAQIEDAQDYADSGGSPYSTTQIVDNAYNIMHHTGMFVETCREWRRRTAADKTWANFKIEFALAHSDLGNLRHTSQAAGYHQANFASDNNFAIETAEALANLATAATADRNMLHSLQTTSQALLQQLTVKDAELTQLRTQVQQFQAGLSNRTNNSTNRRNNTRSNNTSNNPPTDTPGPKRYPNTNYCWTHGYDVDARHESSNCRNPAPGHQTTATRLNPMGGSERNKNRTST